MNNILRFTGIQLLLALLSCALPAQELFVFTEPASNMPAKSLGLRASNWLMYNAQTKSVGYQLLPELMWGVNKNLMVHADGFFTNQNANFNATGAGVYGKYLFYSADGMNKHFRMAGFVRMSFNNSTIFQEEIDLSRNNTGIQGGLIATQLLHRQAISASVSYVRAFDNGNENKFPAEQPDQAINYSISTGRLILPKRYTSYRQANFNLMLEMLGQHLIGRNGSFLDLAPAAQFIFNSQTRVDLGYKFQLYSNMQRTTPNAIMIRIEHLIFNLH